VVLIRSVSGVRGIVGEDLTTDLTRRYGGAFAAMAPGDVAVGWDSRRGGDALAEAVSVGLAEGGARVLDVGIAPTPTIGIAVRRRGLAGGVAVTASHNPEAWNGLKFFSGRGVFLDRDGVTRLFDLVDRGGGAGAASPGSRGRLTGALGDHIDLVLSARAVDRAGIARARPRVVVDCVNGAGSVILPDLLRRLGACVDELWTEPGAGFQRGAEPVSENLGELSKAVRAFGADIGFACDPDADRLAVVDERGRPIGEEYTLAIAALVVLRTHPGPLVANVSTSMMIDEVARGAGVQVYRTAVGEINVVAKMMEVGAVLGGEGNGGVILPDVHLGRDAATAAALVLSGLVADGGRAASELAARFTGTSMIKRKVTLESPSRSGIIDAMKSTFPDGRLDLTDGAKLCWPDRWVHARMSGTEPVVRVIAEALRQDDALELVSRAIAVLSRGAGGS
jgi:phosphomannomutase